jgi:YVTN family beta-propeller protein
LKTGYLLPLLLALVLFAGACDKGLLMKASEIENPVYVLNQYQPSISIIDGDRDELVKNVRLPDVTSTFWVNPEGNLVLAVTARGDMVEPYIREIHVITPDGGKAQESFNVRYIPDDMYLSDDGRIGLVVHNTITSGHVMPVTLIDVENRTLIKKFEIRGFIRGAVYEDNAFWFYVSGLRKDGDELGIYRIDLKALTLTKVSDPGDNYIRVLFKNGKAYGLLVHNRFRIPNNNTLQVIDLKTNKVEKMLQLSKHPYNMAFVEDMLYVTHNNTSSTARCDNRVSVINTNTYEIEDILEVGKAPAAICYSRSLGKAYTANFWGNSVSVIDVKSRKVIKTISVNQKATLLIRCPA